MEIKHLTLEMAEGDKNNNDYGLMVDFPSRNASWMSCFNNGINFWEWLSWVNKGSVSGLFFFF